MTNTDRRYGVSDALAWKAPVRAATTGNIALSGEQTIDGTACAEGDRVLAWQQTEGRENGIYIASTGNWRRAADADGPRDLATGTMLVVTAGLSYQWAIFQLVTTGDIAIGDTTLAFQPLSVAVSGSFRATSATSLAISVAAKTFAVEANRAFTAGDYVIAKSEANANNFMVGQVISYSGTTLVVDVEAVGGSGTHADWSISISGSPGATGATGAPGPAGPAVSGIGDVPGLAAALNAKLDDSQAGAIGLNGLAATTQAAGRSAINAASNSDALLLGRRVSRLFNRTAPMGLSYHPAFVMGDGSVTVCGQLMQSLGQGANTQASLFPTVVVLPEGLLGTPVDVVVTTGNIYILTDQGDVATAGLNAEGECGDNSTTTRTVAVLLNASDITPRAAGGASRAVTKIETTCTFPYSTSAAAQSVFFVCADNSLWATGYHGGSNGTLAGGTFSTNALKPTRCLKIANSTTQAMSQGTASSTTNTPSVASKTFTVSAGKPWVAGDPIFIYSHANTAVWMFGSVTSYSGTTLIVNVTAIGTATASSDWIISELVNDAANVYASGGGPTGSVGYITTSGKARFAGRLLHGMHGLCSTGPGSGIGVTAFPAFRLPKTASDDASSQLPDAYVCTKIVMGANQINDIGSVCILCADKSGYMAGYGTHGANGDGTTVHSPNFKRVGSGTAMAAIAGHVDDVWCVSGTGPSYIAQLDTNQAVCWGQGASYTLPGIAGTAVNATPVVAAAPFNGSKRISKVSLGGHFITSERETVAALTTDNLVYSWGNYPFQGGLAPGQTATPAKVTDPYRGAITISDIKVGGYQNCVGTHILYANGEVWGFNNNTYTNGELGIGSANGPYMPVRMLL